MKYLYIFEDGSIVQGSKPTEVDLQSVGEGVLDIIQFDDGNYFRLDETGDPTVIDEATEEANYHSNSPF